MKRLLILLVLACTCQPPASGPGLPGTPPARIYNVAGLPVSDTSAPGIYYIIEDTIIRRINTL